MKVIKCNKDCGKCRYLNGLVDEKGYPYGYECMKYGDSVFINQFTSTKEFYGGDNSELLPENTLP